MEQPLARHHPVYHFEDGNVIFLLPQGPTLYKLVKSILALHSEYFWMMFTLPMPAGTCEGSEDAHPIVIPEVAASDFDYICAFMYGQFENTDVALSALLNLSSFFDMPKARTHAIQTLETLPTLTAVGRFHLGMCNDLREWIQASFRQIVLAVPIESLTGNDIDAIGIQGYWAITRAKSALQEHHLLLAYWPPDLVVSMFCKRPYSCERGWEKEWWNGFAKHILHPDLESKKTLMQVLAELEAVDIPSVCVDCKAATIPKVRESGSLQREDEIIQEALALVLG